MRFIKQAQRGMVKSTNDEESEDSWRTCRNFCCRSGYFPLIVAAFLSAAFLLDLYTIFGCDFIHVDIGFQPINTGWDQKSLDLGIFFFNNHTHDTDGGPLMQTFHKGCRRYDTLFNQYLIGTDQVWKVSRVLSWISGCAGFLSMILNWTFIITPLPTRCIWASIFLPSVWISFLTCASKFILFGAQVVVSSIWIADGSTNKSMARSKTLGLDGVTNIVASVFYLIGITLICLKTPKRIQKTRFVQSGTFDTDEDLRAHDSGSQDSYHNYDAEASSENFRVKDEEEEEEGLTDGIQLFQVVRKNPPSYDLSHVINDECKHAKDAGHKMNIQLSQPDPSRKTPYSIVNRAKEVKGIASMDDKFTPLRDNKTRTKTVPIPIEFPTDSFDELASRRVGLFSPIQAPKTNVPEIQSLYNYDIIDYSIAELKKAIEESMVDDEELNLKSSDLLDNDNFCWDGILQTEDENNLFKNDV